MARATKREATKTVIRLEMNEKQATLLHRLLYCHCIGNGYVQHLMDVRYALEHLSDPYVRNVPFAGSQSLPGKVLIP